MAETRTRCTSATRWAWTTSPARRLGCRWPGWRRAGLRCRRPGATRAEIGSLARPAGRLPGRGGRALGGRAGQGRGHRSGHVRSGSVRAGPGAGAAQRGAAPAGRQDSGRRRWRGRLSAHPSDPLPGVRPDRPGARRGARVRPRPGRRRLLGARSRPPAVRAQRRAGAGLRGGRVRRLRGQRAEPAAADPAGDQGAGPRRATGRAQPDPGGAGRGDQVPVAAPARQPEVRRLRRRPGGFRLAAGRGPPGRRCLESQVKDWADGVAYSVDDLEDGIHGQLAQLGALRPGGQRGELCKLAARAYSEASPAELADALGRLLALPFWPPPYDGSVAAQVGLKRLTSELIGRFCVAALAATRAAGGSGRLARYAADLVVPAQVRAECALLKAVTARYFMARTGAQAAQERERALVAELVALVGERAPEVLDPALRPAFLAARDDAARLRVAVDHIAGLTDTSARVLHARLAGLRAS